MAPGGRGGMGGNNPPTPKKWGPIDRTPLNAPRGRPEVTRSPNVKKSENGILE